MKIITMYNNKGGVGKTTSVINIAYSLSKMGKKVLIMDLDEQKNSSRFFLESGDDRGCAPTRYENIFIMTYDECISIREVMQTSIGIEPKYLNYEFATQYAVWLNQLEISSNFDYIIFDLPPALNDLTKSMLSFCDYVFVPIELGTFAIQGITVVVNTLSEISAKFGGCFVVKFDNENPSDYSLLDVLKDALGAKVLTSIIPFSRVIKNSISYRMTAAEYMDYMPAAEKYNELTKEIVEICD